jgi:hypothetical protein
MKIKLLLLMFFFCITGCNYKNRLFDQCNWVVIDKSKIEAVLLEKFKINNPIPPEFIMDEESRKEYSLIQEKLYQLGKDASKKCSESAKWDNTRDTPTDDVLVLPPSPDGIVRYVQNPTATDSGLIRNKVYQKCLNNMQNGLLISALQKKLKKFRDIYSKGRDFDDDIRKKAKEFLNKKIAEYGEKNHISLIIDKPVEYRGSNYNGIAYNSDNVVIDVTDDIMQYILIALPKSSEHGRLG